MQYLDGLDEKEKQQLYDLSENAVYDVPGKVKALCEKYGLRYASGDGSEGRWGNNRLALFPESYPKRKLSMDGLYA